MVRHIWTATRVLATAVVFAAAVGASARAHLGVPAVRRAVIERVDRALATAFAGRVTVERIGALSATRVGGVDLEVRDPEGRIVLVVEGLRAHIAPFRSLFSMVAGGAIAVDVSELAVARADVALDTDDSGALRIARAFAPRVPAAPGEKGASVRLSLPAIRVEHARLHGQPPGAPPVDVTVDGLLGAMKFAPGALSVDVGRAAVAGSIPGGAPAGGTIEAHLTMPSPTGRALGVRASWTGKVGAIEGAATGALDGSDVDASVDVPSTAADAIRSLWPACPLTEPAFLEASTKGTLPKLAVRSRVGVGRGTLEAEGQLVVGAGVQGTAHLAAQSLDAHAIAGAAPASDLSGTADLSFAAHPGGDANADFVLETAAGTVAGAQVPAMTVRAKATRGASPGETGATASIRAHEPGVSAAASVRVAPKGESFEVGFEGRVLVARLGEAPRLGRVATGEAAAAVQGTFDGSSKRIDAAVDATLHDVQAGGISLGKASFFAHASGPVASARFDAHVDGDDLAIGPLHFVTVHAESQGTAQRAPVVIRMHGRDAEVQASATAGFAGGPSLRDIVVGVERDGQIVSARVDRASVAGGETRVDDAEVEGLGAPFHAALRQSAGALYVRAHSQRLDLARIGQLLGVKDASGRVGVDVDALLRNNGAQGRVQVDVHDANFAGWRGAEAHLAATLDGRHVAGTASAKVADIGSIDIQTSSLEIGGSDPPTWSYWKRAWGKIDGAAHVDLAKLADALPPDALPFTLPGGRLDATAHLERSSMTDSSPGVDLTARTTGLAVSGEGARGPWRLAGVDASAHVKVDGDTGHTAVDAQLADREGPLATFAATSDGVPYEAVFGGGDVREAARAMPFQAEATVPPRDLAKLPPIFGTHRDRGEVTATLRWSGTPLEPTVDLTAGLRDARPDVRLLALPVTLDLTSHYDGARATAALKATTHAGRILDATAQVDLRAADIVSWTPGHELAWTASAKAKVASFPLQSIGSLDDRSVRGKASGEIAIEGLHDDARASLSIAIDGLKVGELAYKGATLQASVDEQGVAEGKLRIDQDDGYAEAHAKAGAHWGSSLVPSLDASKPVDLSLQAKQYRLGLIAPFVSSLVSTVDGRLNADARLRLDPATETIQPQGTLSLEDGAFELVALGGSFHDVTAKATLTPDGVVRMDGISARGVSGRLEAAATARFDGHGMSGLRGQIQVPAKEQLPVLFEDVQVGTFYGSLAIAADRSPDGRSLGVNVGVKTLHVALPLATGHDVQELGEIAGLRTRRKRARDEAPPQAGAPAPRASATPVEITIDLGKDTEVKRGTTLDVVLEGRPTLSLGGGVRAGGQIRLPRGTIDVQGKEFALENGTVTFVGDDPTNPQVALTARWAAPDGTLVFADFVGPLKTGQVTLRSEPALTKNEIIALIVYGSPDQATAASNSGAQGLNVVGGAAGAAATQPINRVLDSFGLAGGVSTKIDTSGTTPRPEVEVQIARDITLQIAWVLGVPPPGSNPDQTLVTLNWRFLRQWSLRTTVGDAGTSILDLVWQHRY